MTPITPNTFKNVPAAGSQVYRVSKDGRSKRLSASFTVGEFQCKDGTDILLVHPALVALLQRIRDYFKAPVKINSGFRTHAHNRNEGGSEGSLHCDGRAADVVVRGVAPREVAAFARKIGAGGVGTYATWVHVDCGPRRDWTG